MMKINLFIAAVLATATFCTADPAMEQSQVEKDLVEKLTNEMSHEALSTAEVQELNDILEGLLRQTNAVSTQGMSAEMQGFFSSLRRGFGRAFKVARKGVGFLANNVAPLLSQLPGQQYPPPPQSYQPMQYQPRQYQPRQQPMQYQPRQYQPMQYQPRQYQQPRQQPKKKQQPTRNKRRRQQRRGRGRRGKHVAREEQMDNIDYNMENVLSSLQQYDDDEGAIQQYDYERKSSIQQYDDDGLGSLQQYDIDEGMSSLQQYDDESLGSQQQYDIEDGGSLQQYDSDDDGTQGRAKAQIFRLLGGLFRKLFG